LRVVLGVRRAGSRDGHVVGVLDNSSGVAVVVGVVDGDGSVAGQRWQ